MLTSFSKPIKLAMALASSNQIYLGWGYDTVMHQKFKKLEECLAKKWIYLEEKLEIRQKGYLYNSWELKTIPSRYSLQVKNNKVYPCYYKKTKNNGGVSFKVHKTALGEIKNNTLHIDAKNWKSNVSTAEVKYYRDGRLLTEFAKHQEKSKGKTLVLTRNEKRKMMSIWNLNQEEFMIEEEQRQEIIQNDERKQLIQDLTNRQKQRQNEPVQKNVKRPNRIHQFTFADFKKDLVWKKKMDPIQ